MAKIRLSFKIASKLKEDISELAKNEVIKSSRLTEDLIIIGLDYLDEVMGYKNRYSMENEIKFDVYLNRVLKRELDVLSKEFEMSLNSFIIRLIEVGLANFNVSEIPPNRLDVFIENKIPSPTGIYAITNMITNKKYVMGSKNIVGVVRDVKRFLKRNMHPIKPFQKEYNEYGIESFVVELLFSCSEEDLLFNTQKYKVENADSVYNIYKDNEFGLYRVFKLKNENVNQGYVWIYAYQEEGKLHSLTSINLYALKQKVINEGSLWREFTEEAKQLVEKDKMEFLNPNNPIHHAQNGKSYNKSGFYRVHKSKEGYWVYTYIDNGNRRSISRVDIHDLKEVIHEKGLKWVEYTEEAKLLVEKAKNKKHSQFSLDDFI